MAPRQSSTTHSPLPSMTEEEMELFSALLLAPRHTAGAAVTWQAGKIALMRQRHMIAPKTYGEDWWKVQPKYLAKVLIGNWLEKRKRVRLPLLSPECCASLQFTKPCGKLGCSVYSTDFTHFPDHKPERTLRTTMMKKYEDQSFKSPMYNTSSFLVSEPPTNYGLLGLLKRKRHGKEAGVMSSIYTTSYEKPPASAFAPCQFRRAAQPHGLTSRRGHLPRVGRILDYEGGQRYMQALGQLARDRKARAASM
ncbi:hypothetical protein CIB84_009733 [Bambusicola thoracicus]|uniref:Uncharacterized protein n=1 Tax=Bambusicola thoracicus TaxID=9083 RepID=A0A2P4SQX5_BAMTH|nr:hypothetical protein CIB84_009733 [Bambusicola thoracicus]